MYRPLLAWLSGLALFLAGTIGHAESVVVEGAAPLRNQNPLAAREEAIRNALAEAARSGSLHVGSVLGTSGPQTAFDQVVVKASARVYRHQIINESHDGETYRVTLSADLESEPAGSGRPESPLDHTAYAMGRPGRPGRRSFVTAAAGTGIGALTVGGVAALASGRTSAVAAQPLPSPSAPAAPLPPGLETTTRGISALRTPRDEFYRIDTALTIPRVDVSSWTLTIDGMVDHKVVVTWAELLAMDLIERDVTINCVSNEVGGPYIGATRWTGVPVRNILQRAGIRAEADQILSTSVDGMTISTPVEALLDDREALLVVGMDGATLPPEHGFPVRLITPGLYGFVGATKWLSRLTATTYAAQPAYWTERGWAIDAPVQPQARIDVPGRGNSTSAGTVAIGGVAWAMATGGITAVQVRVDDGPWQQARLGPEVGARYWRQWVLPWEARKGRHTITARAVDASGEPQVEAERDPYPSGATGWHSIEVNIT